ncbi:MAG: hypothetical protein JHD33_01970 [Chthoniobacterales bacterium]|jgi:hypothetical protein|nr:hypothetical protein [Chthoniobacterales bacterium]
MSTNLLSEQKQRIVSEQARIAREMVAAEKQARQKPKPVRVALEPARRLRVSTAPQRILPPRPPEHLFPGGRMQTTRKQFRRRKTEVRLEQVKFLLLCVLFAALILFAWKHLP